MGKFARLREYLVLGSLLIGLFALAPRAVADDAFVRNRRPSTLQSLIKLAPPPSTAMAVAASDPICDIFANGYEVIGATPCSSCFDATKDLDESDVDCGGAYCKGCSDGQQCVNDTDCLSGVCAVNACVSPANVPLISQVQTRGDNGASDEFVEIYNPSTLPVTFDATWTLSARSNSSSLLLLRFSGGGQVIPAHGHVLYGDSAGYNGPTNLDGTYTNGISDASSLVLKHGSTVVDALCFGFDAASTTPFTSDTTYVCEGLPVGVNPHNNLATTNVDASLERKPGGSGGNMHDTNDNANDFLVNPVSDPHNLGSSPTP